MNKTSKHIVMALALILAVWTFNANADERYKRIEMGDGHFATFRLTAEEIAAEELLNRQSESAGIGRTEAAQKWVVAIQMPDAGTEFIFPLSATEIEKAKQMADSHRESTAPVTRTKTGTTIEMGDGRTITFYSVDTTVAMNQDETNAPQG